MSVPPDSEQVSLVRDRIGIPLTPNYDSLLRVCGTATHAFINLTNSAGLLSRRILLLNSNPRTKHADAEVLVDDLANVGELRRP